MGFDELNVISTMKDLYAQLEGDNEEAFYELAVEVYRQTTPHGDTPPTKKWLYGLLEEYDPVTLYVYLSEVDRKRDRTTEAVIAANNKAKEFRRGESYWAQMTAHYADEVTYQAMLKAYEDAGVKKVRWVTQKDERVCEECSPRDGKVYELDKVPPKPHWGCRCYLEPVV